MPEDIDNSLLERLQALRGSSSGASPGRAAAPIQFSVDVIERLKPATREDGLAARLKSLRAADEGSAVSPKREKAATAATALASSSPSPSPSHPNTAGVKYVAYTATSEKLEDGQDVDLIFSTDDQTLEELLGDVNPDEAPAQEPSDEQVRALLEELSRAVPKDDDAGGDGDGAGDSDDSDGERMQSRVTDVIAQFQDEADLEAALRQPKDGDETTASGHQNQYQDEDASGDGDADLALPTLPPNLDDLSSFSPRRPSTTTAKADAMEDITARLAALRASAAEEDEDAAFSLPSVPSGRPSAADKPVRRLTSKTDYTDDDIDGWCTVCLDDATLQCLGCDHDPYCTRCWREMHVGPAAAFDDRSHKAVQITRARKKDKQRVALGA